ncbi:MAG TPA: FG-GAP-like repeat-containing protein, partial [Planctomycetaceae bacterium]
MSTRFRLMCLALTCALAVGAVTIWRSRDKAAPRSELPAAVELVIDNSRLADAGFTLAGEHTGEVRDPASLTELRAAIEQRGPAALAALEAQLADVRQSVGADSPEIAHILFQLSTILTYEGRLDDAISALEQALSICEATGQPLRERARLTAILGVLALRRGEVDNCINCVGASSCIFPIAPSAVHTRQAGSRRAIELFATYLAAVPGDLRVRWLLNLAYMTLGEYPDQVPPRYLVPLDTFESTVDVGRFTNVAPLVGLTSRGPNQAGGSIFDDFTGDGLPDLLVTSLDVDRGAALYVNRGNGKFDDQSAAAGLDEQVYALNLARGDFDNDGNLDFVLLRGAWEQPMRMSLLRNTGNGTFEDVTISSGLADAISTESAVWGDYDDDGLVDLFVCGEYFPPSFNERAMPPEPRNRCRLYHNEGQCKFVDVAASAGVTNERCAKGSAWGDYDGDGRLDLFVSNMNAPCRLYHNEGNGTFRDVAAELRVVGPAHAFACWFWDYDNDGRLDLYVNDYTSSLAEFVAASLKAPFDRSGSPRLYRNVGADGFQDVTHEAGLDREFMPMGCNFGDIDNDGFLDFYLGTGRMSLDVLVPNLMFRNDAGRRFDDVTTSSGTGHLQKGHGISFADWDGDGDLDLFVVAGGAVPGDRSYNLLFNNPGHGRHWLKVKLVGATSNRASLGARIQAVIRETDGKQRSIYRTVGNNGSFGGNSLVESIGLLDATNVAELKVFWPTSRTTQTFRDIAADQAIE